MGAWNAKPFGNDNAGDWLWELEKAEDGSVLKAAFAGVLKARTSPEAPECQEAMAAAAVVEAARQQPIGKLPPEARRWVSEQGFVPANALVAQAISAMKRVLGKSELRELWSESKSFAQWQEQMELLLRGLQRAQATPPPTRKPKAPSPPRLLHKLIELVSPDTGGPLREKLQQKLEAIKDVNAPIKGTLFKTPLNLVVDRGLMPEAIRLIERGARVNPTIDRPDLVYSPLEVACRSGGIEMVKSLLEAGATLCAKHDSNQGGRRYSRAVRCAVESGNLQLVQLLVQRGANLRQLKFNRETLLHDLFDSRDPSAEMVELLVKSGVDVNAQDDYGETAYYKAAQRGKVIGMRKLFEFGANPNLKNSEGETILDWFNDAGARYPEIVRLIKKHGGRLGKEV